METKFSSQSYWRGRVAVLAKLEDPVLYVSIAWFIAFPCSVTEQE